MSECNHKRADYCICDKSKLEPSEACEIHGAGEYPKRCVKCGQYFAEQKLKEIT
jgi:hypothetical protein